MSTDIVGKTFRRLPTKAGRSISYRERLLSKEAADGSLQ